MGQLWRPQVMHLQYERYHRVPFVENDTCFIIGGWIEPFIEQSYISYNSFYNAEGTAANDVTINQCYQSAGKCTVDSPMLNHNYIVDTKTAQFFQGFDGSHYIDRYLNFQTRSNVEEIDEGLRYMRENVIATSSATRAPPTRNLIEPGVNYTHTILSDNEGKPYLYTPCLYRTYRYMQEVNDYLAGKVHAIDADDQSYFRWRV